jgi:ABC-type amino acid transport substrate-binding protein
MKKKVRIVTVLVEPFVMIKRDCDNSNATECQGNDQFEGYCIDLLKLLADRIEDFNYEIFVSAGNKHGSKQPDGSWDGLIGYLLKGEAEAAVASLTINQVKVKSLRVTQPIFRIENELLISASLL